MKLLQKNSHLGLNWFAGGSIAWLMLAVILSCSLIAAETNVTSTNSAIETLGTNTLTTNDVSATLTNASGTNINVVSTNATSEVVETNEGDSSPQKTNTFSGQDLASFKIIADRNIFNMNRSPRSSGRRSRASTKTKAVKIDSFGLVGTLSSDKGQFAFFDGSSSDYRKALKVDDTIGGYKLAHIDSNAVKLESKGKDIEMIMGMQLRREEEGDWQISTQMDSYATSSSSNSTGSTNNTEASSGAASDVLKRLMEQREKELNK